MAERWVRVAVNGYGVIGKRVADAVAAQKDMTLAGVVDVGGGPRPGIQAPARGGHVPDAGRARGAPPRGRG